MRMLYLVKMIKVPGVVKLYVNIVFSENDRSTWRIKTEISVSKMYNDVLTYE